MKTQTYLKFTCVYCGQHMECKPCFSGRQMLCPTCEHRIVIPVPGDPRFAHEPSLANDTWETSVPMPKVETPTRYRNQISHNALLAQAA